MKIILIAILFTSISNAQIGETQTLEKSTIVGEVKMPHKMLEYYVKDGNKLYILTFGNAEYPNITDIRQLYFYADDDELEYLYQFLKDGFGNNEQRTLKVGEDTITTNPFMGAIALTVFYKNGDKAWTDITKRQLDKLFGKR